MSTRDEKKLNPWMLREARISARFFTARDPITRRRLEAVEIDAIYNEPDFQKPEICSGCGGETWKKAGPGTYVCPTCGQVGK